VVVNAGALYRLRYAFWIMLIIIAAEGLLILKSGLRDGKRSDERKGAGSFSLLNNRR